MYVTTRQKRKIFSILVLLCGVGMLFVLGFIFVAKFWKHSNLEIIPQNVILSNWSHDSVTITWTTEKRTKGRVQVYQDYEQIGEFEDSRGKEATFTHYVVLKNLEPNTKYSFNIVSNKETFSGESEFEYVFVSAPVIGNTPNPNVVHGKIDDWNGSDALIFLFANEVESSIISTYVRNNGEWSLDLMDLRSVDLKEYTSISYDSDSMVSLLFFSKVGSKIILGNNNTLFGEDRFIGNIKLTGKEEDIFASLHEHAIPYPLVMGEQDEIHIQNGRKLIRGSENNEEKNDNVSNERQRRVDWTPLGY
jgi:hypothetical protein